MHTLVLNGFRRDQNGLLLWNVCIRRRDSCGAEAEARRRGFRISSLPPDMKPWIVLCTLSRAALCHHTNPRLSSVMTSLLSHDVIHPESFKHISKTLASYSSIFLLISNFESTSIAIRNSATPSLSPTPSQLVKVVIFFGSVSLSSSKVEPKVT